jgi:transposase
LESKDQQIEALSNLVNKLLIKIESLEDELAHYRTKKNSSNSSIPPSKDENRPFKSQSLRKSSGKKSGGQSGHEGHTLEMRSTPDQVIEYIPDFCNCCGNTLDHIDPILNLRRQEIELPIPKVEYIEHRSYEKICQCGHSTKGQLPDHLKAPIQYGSNIEALVGYLHARQYLPYGRLSELLSTCFGVKISQGSIDNILQRLAEKAQGVYQRIHQEISSAAVVGSDETGAKVNGKKYWIWTWQNESYSYISVSPSRGYQVIKDEFPDGLPNAILCHDAWKPHFQLHARGHQLCIAHLLRNLEYLEMRYQQPWATQCKTLFFDSLQLKKELPSDQYNTQSSYSQRTILEERMDRLLEIDIDREHKELVAFSKRLKRYRQCLLLFLYEHDVPPDNNGSERAIRNIKVKQKISGQFRSYRGADNFVILRSVIDTLVKQSLDVLTHLQLIAKLCPE